LTEEQLSDRDASPLGTIHDSVIEQVPPTGEPAPGWGQSLYTGAAGIALMYVEQACSGATSWAAAQQWIAAMVRNPVAASPDTSALHHGAPAVAFTLHAADRPGYAPALAVLDEHITALTEERLRQAHQRMDEQRLPALREYDLVRGLTGVGAYLLHRYGGGSLLQRVLAYLVRLTQPVALDDGDVLLPGWWTDNGPNDRPSRLWPGGHANHGLAHGITGPLALLGTALQHGIIVQGHGDAIERICAWLDRWRSSSSDRAWWPGIISAAEQRAGMLLQREPDRPSWCYGTPGLARAQQIAALATGDSHRRRRAEQSLARCVADERQLGQLHDASLCHGWAGLVLTAWRVAADADDPEPLAVPRLLSRLQQYLTDHGPSQSDGLLDGRAGVHLTLRTVTRSTPSISGWDACLLLGAGRTVPPITTHSDRERTP
jgi:hypothetical protein